MLIQIFENCVVAGMYKSKIHILCKNVELLDTFFGMK